MWKGVDIMICDHCIYYKRGFCNVRLDNVEFNDSCDSWEGTMLCYG